MAKGAQTPEELEMLLEDAFVMRDRGAVAELFEPKALLAVDGLAQARGAAEIGRCAGLLLTANKLLVAQPRRVLQLTDTALVVAEQGTSIARRDHVRGWRYAISLINPIQAPHEGKNE